MADIPLLGADGNRFSGASRLNIFSTLICIYFPTDDLSAFFICNNSSALAPFVSAGATGL